MAVALKEDRAVRGMEAVAERPDGTRVPFIPYPTPIHDETGKLVGAVNMLVDITERKRAEEQQALMVRELHHRVKNTLATVQAIMGSTARLADNIEEFKTALFGRIRSLSKTHLLLSRGRARGGVRRTSCTASSMLSMTAARPDFVCRARGSLCRRSLPFRSAWRSTSSRPTPQNTARCRSSAAKSK